MRSPTGRGLLTFTTTLAVSLPVALAPTSADATRAERVGDPTAHLDAHGRGYYVDVEGPGAEQASTGPGVAEVPGSLPNGSTFKLHSRPVSHRTIFLDFDGADVTGTAWNSEFGLPSGAQPSWTFDDDPDGFSVAEKHFVQRLWQWVAEDFAPFDVDVTTEDPGVQALERSDASDTEYGMRVLFSSSAAAEDAICGSDSTCAGAAYTGTFGTPTGGTQQPVWVFSGPTDETDDKRDAEQASHELGHAFGLHHDGTTDGSGTCPSYGTDRYCGVGAARLWAPIMGQSRFRPLTGWNKGEYNFANNHEDDLAIIAAKAPLVPDEAGGDIATAAAAVPTGRAVISSATDADTFLVGTCSGPVTLSADPVPVGPNLDIRLELLDGAGAVVDDDEPVAKAYGLKYTTGLAATLTADLPAGTYYARVDGVGGGSGFGAYTDYGSIGAYTLTKSGCTTPSAPERPTVTGTVPGATRMAVSFAPGPDTGPPVTGYTAQCKSLDGGTTGQATGTASPLTVTGLTEGATYRCRVRATNAIGTSGYSTYGVTVLAGATVPPAPHLTSSSPVGGGIEVTITSNGTGGAPITGYTSQCTSSDGGVPGTASGTRSPVGVWGLTTAASYRCRVRATNVVGAGPWSTRSDSLVITPGRPQPPTVTDTRNGTGPLRSLEVSFTPGSDGGAPVTSFEADCVNLDHTESGRSSRYGTSSPIAVWPLQIGGTYACRVRARNEYGRSRWSALGAETQLTPQ